jgi:hypothetical protein
MKEAFYAEVQAVLDDISLKYGIKVVEADWSARIGCKVGDFWDGVHGRFIAGEIKKSIQLLLEFALRNNLCTANSDFKK